MDDFVSAYKTALNRYADFTGRTSVPGFWRFVAVNFVIALVLGILSSASSIFALAYFAYALALLIPSLAIAIRRLHDTGKSGWMLLLGLIPLAGFIILIVFYVQPSDGPNTYGAGPED
ncbi:MAG TPA: DUF805 domain-containing protein [Acidimicrobiales bacterium]|nr:DUF805 domain-containing protein [Acidimicrobiales bacterium]